MNESDHKRKLVAEINALRGGYARRIEDRWAIGVLDMVIKLPGHPVLFAEGKLIKGHKFFPTQRQWVEGERIIAAGIPALLIGWKDGQIAISPWVKSADWRECKTGTGSIATLMEYLNERG